MEETKPAPGLAATHLLGGAKAPFLGIDGGEDRGGEEVDGEEAAGLDHCHGTTSTSTHPKNQRRMKIFGVRAARLLRSLVTSRDPERYICGQAPFPYPSPQTIVIPGVLFLWYVCTVCIYDITTSM